MISTIFVALLIVIILLYQTLKKKSNTNERLPPGPQPWPIVGNILQLDFKQPEQTLLKWKYKYGNVFTVWLPLPSVIFVDYDDIKETFVKQGEQFAGRPELFITKYLVGGNFGLVFNDNLIYKSQRRFSLHVLRDFGLGRNVLQETIIDQARKITAILHATNGSTIELKTYFTTAVGNIINMLIFGYTYEFDDPKLHRFKQLMDDLLMAMSSVGMLAIEQAPWIRHLDSIINFGYRKTKRLNDEIMEFCRVEVEKHRSTIKYNQPPRDYTDAYLMEIERRKNDRDMDGFSELQMLCAIADLFFAGFETTITTLLFAIRYLIAHPDVQHKIHNEIDKEIGRDRDLSMDDQRRLPFLCATIQEVQRLANILPIMLQHTTLDDIKYNGYSIPKGTIVIPQIPSLHIDSQHFPNPTVFDPMRFIDSNGQFIKSDKVMPFSTGKRSCLGENLARMELFLFLGSFLQKCEFLPTVDELQPIKVEVTMNVFMRQPTAYCCRVISRI